MRCATLILALLLTAGAAFPQDLGTKGRHGVLFNQLFCPVGSIDAHASFSIGFTHFPHPAKGRRQFSVTLYLSYPQSAGKEKISP